MNNLKYCSLCIEWLDRSEFRQKKEGLSWLCKQCERLWRRDYARRNKEHIKARVRAYNQAHREEFNAKARARYWKMKGKR